jgi:DHA1 family inner membrane transport protein
MGLGMTVGIALGGIAADRDLRRSVLFGFAGLITTTAFFAVAAGSPAGLVLGAFLVGAASMFIVPALQSRLIAVAPGAQMMGAAVNQSSLNIANSIGAALGGAVIAAGRGYLASAWLGVALSVGGLVLALISFRLERTVEPAAARPEPVPA